MTEPTRAVFLSYASQDAQAARRIADALRAAGIEVWFDQSELRGGDAWDRQIRKQIHDCALFVPIISATTQGRLEGYFRREWRLAVDRTHDMADGKPFLVPVVIDETTDQDAEVSDSFRAVQWSRLPAGETPPAFAQRVLHLLSPSQAHAPAQPTVAAAPAPTHRQPAPSPAISRRTQIARLLITAVAVIGVGYFALHRFVLSKRPAAGSQNVASTSQTGAPVPAVISEKSIAVLPFVDMSEKKDQEYFSDGLADELLDLLSQVPDLRVPARTSSFYFKGKQVTVAEIAKALSVAHVLEGSVRKSGNTLRVTVQLIRAENGYHLWSKTYDRDIKDIFKVQDEIAGAVVEALKAKLLPAQQVAGHHRTANTEAYAQYLLGNQFRLRDTHDTNRRALAAYQKAVALDPGYAAAYSGLSNTEWRIADQSTAEDAGYQRAAAAADKAIAFAPDSPDGYWARGLLRYAYFFDWNGARADFEKALDLDPNNVRTQVDYGLLLATLGRMPDAIAMVRKAIGLDPLSVEAWRRLAQLLLDSGQVPAARDAIDRALDIDPQGDPSGVATAVDLVAGRPQEALTASQKRNVAASAGFGLVGMAMAEHTLGHAAESLRALDVLIQDHSNVWAYQIAQVYAWRGETDKALEWLERAYRQHDGGLTSIAYDRFFAGLRGDPRYKALLRKMKLPE